MADDQKILDMIQAGKEGDRLFNQGQFAAATLSYRRALELSQALPSAEMFDRPAFDAACQAGLSGALGQQGLHEESLIAAEAALNFFDRNGPFYPADSGPWLMAVYNRGAALLVLGRYAEALKAFERAREMLAGAAPSGRKQQWLEQIEQNIQIAEGLSG